MARIKIEDIPLKRELSENELDQVAGGLMASFSQLGLMKPAALYGSFSITSIPLPGVTVAGVRG